MATLRERIPLRRRKIIKKSVGSVFRKVVYAFLASLVAVFVYDLLSGGENRLAYVLRLKEEQLVTLWVVGMAMWILSEPFYQYLYYVNYFYDMDDKNVIIRKGVLVTKEIILPFSKITDVYVDQDVADVALGLFDVHISTPTVESGLFAHVDGVDRKGANELRKLILDRMADS